MGLFYPYELNTQLIGMQIQEAYFYVNIYQIHIKLGHKRIMYLYMVAQQYLINL